MKSSLNRVMFVRDYGKNSMILDIRVLDSQMQISKTTGELWSILISSEKIFYTYLKKKKKAA